MHEEEQYPDPDVSWARQQLRILGSQLATAKKKMVTTRRIQEKQRLEIIKKRLTQ
jgi:hypothetical protein